MASSLGSPPEPFSALIVDADNMVFLDWGFTREDGAGCGRGGISENGEELGGMGGGGNLGAGGIISVEIIIGGMADAIFLGEEAVGGVLGREEVDKEGEIPKPTQPTLFKLVSEEKRLLIGSDSFSPIHDLLINIP